MWIIVSDARCANLRCDLRLHPSGQADVCFESSCGCDGKRKDWADVRRDWTNVFHSVPSLSIPNSPPKSFLHLGNGGNDEMMAGVLYSHVLHNVAAVDMAFGPSAAVPKLSQAPTS